MLKNLHIENYVLIDRLDLDLENGLNIITGETGAGKSILLGAIALVLGERSDNGVIRQGAKNCVIEATFTLDANEEKIRGILDANEIEYDREITIRKIISPTKSRSFLNDLPVTLPLLRELSSCLVDIHSQHQSLLIGDASFQTGVLDAIAGTAGELAAYREIYGRREKTGEAVARLKKEQEEAKREEDYIRYQLDQLREAKLSAGEEESLSAELELLGNAAQIGETLSGAVYCLQERDESLLAGIQEVGSRLNRIFSYLPEGETLAQRLASAQIELKEICRELDYYRASVNEDPARKQAVEERLDRINGLLQKHRCENTAGLLELQRELEARVGTIDGYEERLGELEAEERRLTEEARKEAQQITAKRKKAVPAVEKNVTATLKELGIPQARFEISLEEAGGLTPSGADRICFLFSANSGLPAEKIDRVASGGEISRLMLALKALVSETRRMPTLIFDEIDTGVSGRVADKMGEIMETLARRQQIINITHLPQVASKGEHHFFVYKTADETGTQTRIAKLDEAGRVGQIAVMLSGSTVTEAALAQARLLLGKS